MRTTITTRKKILKAFQDEGKEIRQIMAELNLSYFQVYNVIRGRVKTTYASRSDKGGKRSFKFPTKTLEEFNSPEEFLQFQLFETMRQLQNTSLAAWQRVKVIKDATRIQRDIRSHQLENMLKRPDAVIIARIMRRFEPKLTDDQIIQIYKEELDKIQREPR